MNDILNWGIIGSGYIARKFAEGLSVLEEARIYGAAGRSRKNLEVFICDIGKYETDRINRYETPKELLSDPNIDIVYVGVLNTAHYEMVKSALIHGKHVLCEKPFMLNARQADEVIRLAKEKHLFLMEAMWSKFTPAVLKAKEIMKSGRLGNITHIKASFGWHTPVLDGKDRLFDADKGGGILLDAGIYPIAFAMNFMERKPDRIFAFATIGMSGVDEVNDLQFIYHEQNRLGGKQDVLCHLDASARCLLGEEARVSFEFGEIYFPVHWAPQSLQVTYPSKDMNTASHVYKNIQGFPDDEANVILQKSDYVTETIECPFQGNGYEYEAKEAMRCVRHGLTESPIHSQQMALDIMTILDEIQVTWKY